MVRRFLLFLSVLCFFCTAASATDQHIHLSFTIHQPASDTMRCADLITGCDGILIFSDLFPSSYLSVPVTDVQSADDNAFLLSSFPLFAAADLRPVLNAWCESLHPETFTGIFTGDIFDRASVMAQGVCGWQDFVRLVSAAAKAFGAGASEDISDLLPRADSSFIPAFNNLTSIVYRIYDSADYFSFEGKEEERTVFTISFNVSDSLRQKILFGFVENGKNYYRYIEVVHISDHELHINLCFYTDEMQNGFRSIERQSPVLRENWILLLSGDQSGISFTGEIQPQNELNDVLINGELSARDKMSIFADITFRDYPDTCITIAAEISDSPVSVEGLNEITVDNLSDITFDSSFAQELTDNILNVYTSLLFALPSKYVERFLNLF